MGGNGIRRETQGRGKTTKKAEGENKTKNPKKNKNK